MNLSSLAIVAAITISPATASASVECGPAPFDLQVVIKADAVTINRSLGSAELGKMLSASSLTGYVTQGLTAVQYAASYTTQYESSRRTDGNWCSRAKTIRVDFGFRDAPKIFISSGIQPGSCLDMEILKHEYQHLAIAQGTLASGQKYIDQALRKTIASGGAVGPTANAANEVIDAEILRIIDAITSKLYENASTRNMALDTPANYARLGSVCG